MTLTRWDPFGEMLSLRKAMDRLLEESFVRPTFGWGEGEAGGVDVDLMEKDDALVVKASLPGVKPEDTNVTVENNVLTIRGEMREEQERKDERYHRRERRYGSVARRIALPTAVNADAAQARFEHGVLTITLPKAEEARQKRIEVRGAASGAIEAPKTTTAEPARR